jgi:hypothetical protein
VPSGAVRPPEWADWEAIEGPAYQYGKGVKYHSLSSGYAVGDQKKQAAVLLSAGLRQIARNPYARWCGDTTRRARGMVHAIGVVYPDLRNPYHSSTKRMLPESSDDELYQASSDGRIGRRFTDEDLIRFVVRDVAQTFRKNALVFSARCVDETRS